MKLKYVIKYVADMDRAVGFHREKLGLSVQFESPGWTEFSTGETTLALHPASESHLAGSAQLGFGIDEVERFYDERESLAIEFVSPPTEIHGEIIARFLDSEGAECSISNR